MKKLLANILIGDKKSLLSLVSDKTGKISFRRSASVVVLSTIVAPHVERYGLTWMTVVLSSVCILAPCLEFIFTRKKKETSV